MRIFSNYNLLLDRDRGAAVAIGNFDGIHIGHQSVIERARQFADARQIPLGVMTFEPHPREFFGPETQPFRLMSRKAKERQLRILGVDILYELQFDAELAGMSPVRFVDEILRRSLAAKAAIVGSDFRFGKDRSGNADSLATLSHHAGFELIKVPIRTQSDVEISSTAVRAALSAGNPDEAASLLGRWHQIDGVVVKGAQRGRQLGFPTANLEMHGLHAPRYGIYAAIIDILSGPHKGQYSGVASIGVRPTFGSHPVNLEVYLFDFGSNIYDEEISVSLVAFQRAEMEFENQTLLVRQMKEDCSTAQKILGQLAR
ncbi:MAG: bifunctional riboflavin kinase/FAD synthetase [Rhodobacteraceae bacterium]|nr:bifunctional riboflavin kinase/FAD synthetase [Paracoccaceae bacterium]